MGFVGVVRFGPNPYDPIYIQLSLSFYATSVSLSTISTFLICYRLFKHARRMKECLGGQFASPYFTVATLVIESVLPCTLTGITFFGSFGGYDEVGLTFWYVYTLVMVRRSNGSIHGADRFVVYIAADVDLACSRGKCMADRHDHGAKVGDKVLSGQRSYFGFEPLRWGRSESNAFGDVAERVSSGVGVGFGQGVSSVFGHSRLGNWVSKSWSKKLIKPLSRSDIVGM